MNNDSDGSRRDLVVLGAGPAGMAAALTAAARGQQVTLVSGGNLIGDGLQGAYKSKAMWELASDRTIARKRGFASPTGDEVSFAEIHEQLERGAEELTDVYRDYLGREHVEFVEALVASSTLNTVEANGRRMAAEHFIIATGARPRTLPGVAIDGRRIMTTQHVVDVDRPTLVGTVSWNL